MLSMTRVSAGQADTYYTADDYYLQNVGTWQGELANKLGLSGVIKQDDFKLLIQGTDPNGKFQVSSGGREHIHTAGVDLTFSAPKSVSIMGLVVNDVNIIEAHDKAVKTTLDYMEKNYTNVRIKENGGVLSQATSNMIVAKFQHISSRELDPQLHTHCLVLNMTQKENGDIRAMDYKEIYDRKMFLGQMYRNELAMNLKELGYGIQVDNKGLFEIAGLPKDLMQSFSTRSEQIKQRVQELKEKFPNVGDAELKAMATLDTRKIKDEPSVDELKEAWDKLVKEHGFSKAELNNLTHQQINDNKINKPNINTILQQAITIATEHEAVANKDDILRVASKLSVGHFRLSELEAGFNDQANLVKLEDKLYTTPEIIQMERSIVDTVRSGQGKLPSIFRVDELKQGIQEYEKLNGFELTNGQKNAIIHVLNSRDRIIAIQGDAGTGKTTMLDVVRFIAEKKECEIIGLSFTGKAASEIEEASTIKSRTVASLINSQDNLHGKIVVVDEASMLSIKDASALLKKCDKDTRIVLVGDTKQLQSIGQGKIFSSLQEKQVISTVRMSEVQRQTDNEYKDVVYNLAAKKVEIALAKLDAKDKIIQIQNQDKMFKTITDKYLENPKSTIVVTSTNKDRVEFNNRIRNELIQNGGVKSSGREYLTREVKSLIADEKNYAQSYSTGDIVVANKEGILGKAGTEGRVVGIDITNHMLEVKVKNKNHTIDLKENGQHLQLYRQESKTFAQGDKVLFLKNDRGLEVKNGQTGVIQNIYKDGSLKIKMDNKKELKINPSTQYNYLSHGYALTDYKSQGQTAKHVIYHANTNSGINFNQAYVGITRGKESVHIYTDDKEVLFEKVKHEQVKTTTLDYEFKTSATIAKERLLGILHQPAENKVEQSQSKTGNVEINTTASVKKISYTKEFSYWDAKVVSDRLADNVESVLDHIMSGKHTKTGNQFRYGKHGSLSVTVSGSKAGYWRDFETDEGGKSLLSLIQRECNMGFKESLEYGASLAGLRETDKTKEIKVITREVKQKLEPEFDKQQKNMIKVANAIAKQSTTGKNTLAEDYLRSRGITAEMPNSIEFNPNVYIKKYDKSFPAMVVKVHNEKGAVQSVHITLLDSQKISKANVEQAKLKFGPAPDNINVSLNDKSPTRNLTLVAEGLETSLSIKSAFTDCDVKSALSKCGFNRIDPKQTANNVVLCIDNDLKDWRQDKVINNAAIRLTEAGKTVWVAMPNAHAGQKTDFNDVLKASGKNEIITTINNAQKYQDLVDNKVILTRLGDEINNLKQPSVDEQKATTEHSVVNMAKEKTNHVENTNELTNLAQRIHQEQNVGFKDALIIAEDLLANTKLQSVTNELDKVAQVKDKLTEIANKIPKIKDGFDIDSNNEKNIVNSQETVQNKDSKTIVRNHKIDISR